MRRYCKPLVSPVSISCCLTTGQSFDFGVFPGTAPCASNLTLNSIPLDGSLWHPSLQEAHGSAAIAASGHDLTVSWYSACDTSKSAVHTPSRVLTVTVEAVNGVPISSPSPAGFTISFEDVVPPRLLRYSLQPVSPQDIDYSWYAPPAESKVPVNEPVRNEKPFEDNVDELRRLEIDLALLKKEVAAKERILFQQLKKTLEDRLGKCDGPFCVFRSVVDNLGQRIRIMTGHLGSPALKSKSEKTLVPHRLPGTSMAETKGLPARPELCHCRDGKPVEPAPSSPNAQLPDDDHSPPRSKASVFLHFILLISGLALIIAFARRCCRCCSPRRRRDHAARREAQRRRCQYQRAAARHRFLGWMRGGRRRSESPVRSGRDVEEKQALVGAQEAVLEGAMQDQIHQLKIREEIRRFRNGVDELVRAEEGRSPYYTPPAGGASHFPARPGPSTGGFAPVPVPGRPRPIAIIPTGGGVMESSDEGSTPPFSPVSRTTSLPSYRSKPPSYKEEASSDGFSDCSIGPGVGGDGDDSGDDDDWASGSSLPDLDPRPSGETIRTFV